NTDSTWVITWPDEGHVGNVAFSEVEHLVGAPDNQDTFRFTADGNLSGSIEGGARGFDSLIIDDRPVAKVIYQVAGADSGSIDLDGAVILYSGLEPITDNSNAVDRVLTATPSIDHIRLKEGPALGQLTIENTSGGF